MGLDVFDTGDVGCVGIGPLDGEHLPLLPGRPETLSLAIAGHAEAADHSPDAVTVGDRSGELLDHQRHIALGRDQAVGIAAKRTGAGIAHRLGRREEHEAIRLTVRGTSHDCLIDASLEQRPGTDRHRLQRRGAGSINHEIGALERERLMHDLGSGQCAQVELRAWCAASVAMPHGCGHLSSYSLDIIIEQGTRGIDLRKQSGCLIDAGCIDDITNPGAAAGVANINAGPSVDRHGEGIEASVPTGLGGNLQKDRVGHVVSFEHLGSDRAGGRINRPVGDDAPHL